MIVETKLRKIGNSLGIVLPKEVVQALRVEEGASLYITEGVDSSVRIMANDPNFDKAIAVADCGMNKYRNALRELAK